MIATVTAGPVGAVAKARRDIISHFMARNAVSPESATSYDPARRIQSRMFDRLEAAGVLKPGAKGGHYLDVPAWDAYSRTHRRRAGAMIGISAAIAGALVAIFA